MWFWVLLGGLILAAYFMLSYLDRADPGLSEAHDPLMDQQIHQDAKNNTNL